MQKAEIKLKNRGDFMETKFNSQICTTREQSERLLALGLKKETADMYYEGKLEGELPRLMSHKTEMDYFNLWDSIIPAWSLHRLWELGKFMGINLSSEVAISNLYEYAIANIERQIKKGYFNKEYLV